MSAAATTRWPLSPRTVTDPSAASSTAGMSDAGSPCASVPPSVPRLRTCGSAIVAAAADASPRFPFTTSTCRVIAPIRKSPFSRWMPARPGTRRRSTSSAGAASRSFINGSSECPPASTFASSELSAASASSSESGAT